MDDCLSGAPPLACRTSPPQGGRSAVPAPRLELRRRRLAKAVERLISSLEGEMAGRPEGDASPKPPAACPLNPPLLKRAA
ncbi:hypothetical protein CK216_05350 [Mesorhizobium sp. WSM3876]|nr:hypothetical protein CK216_05350 [Mesorhizobium sp. WSM3876]